MEAEETGDFVKKDYVRPRWFRDSKFYKTLREHEISDESCSKHVGSVEEDDIEEMWPIDKPLTKKEVDIYLRMNKLRRLYLDCEKWEILQLDNIHEPVDEIAYWDFVLYLTKCYERLGEKYVNYILEPLGFQQHRYVGYKRIR